jgi:hypothetical protein
MTRKEDVTKQAQDLGIQVYKSWTIAEIEAAIARKNDERVAKQREADREREARPNAITTSGMGIDPNLKDGDEDDSETEEQVYVAPRTDDSPSNDELPDPAPTEDADEDRNAVKNLPNPTHDEQVEEGKVVVRYIRDVGSYTIGRLRFTPNAPFKVVSEEFADKHFHEGHPDIRRATPEEVKEYYS